MRKKDYTLKLGFIFIITIFSIACINVSYSGFTAYISIDGSVKNWEEPASIGDYVWNDQDRDGIRDLGELNIPEVEVNLYTGDDTFLESKITDINGYYLFYDLIPGEYYIEFILPDGYFFTIMNSGIDDEKDSDTDTITGKTINVFLKPGDNDLRWDSGMYTDYEGCTQGFWKTHQNEWIGYQPSQKLYEVFHIPIELIELESYTLLEALSLEGGASLLDKAENLIKVAVGALLNAAHPDVDYPLSETQVINDINNALSSLNPSVIEYQMLLLDYHNCLQACLCP